MIRRPAPAVTSVLIIAGWLIFGLSAPSAVEKDHIIVEVKQGDTLWGIAVKHLEEPARWKEILEYNNLEDPNVIHPGMKLKIPRHLLKGEKPAVSVQPAGPQPEKSAQPEGKDKKKTPDTSKLGAVVHVARDAVQTKSDGSDETLRVGGVLKTGSKVITDDMSFCTINLGGGLMVVGPATRLKVALIEQSGSGAGSRAYIRLVRGIIRFDAATDLDLRAKTDAALVRANGACFTVRKEEEGRTFVDVYAGKVDISSGNVKKKIPVGEGMVFKGEGDVIGPAGLPPAPKLSRERVTAGGSTHVGARWNHVDEASSYRVEVALDEDFTRPVYFGGYAGDSIDFDFLASYPPGEYRLRLRSVNKKGLWSAPSNFLSYVSQP